MVNVTDGYYNITFTNCIEDKNNINIIILKVLLTIPRGF